MPFSPGEDVNLRFVSTNPDGARLDFMGQSYTVANLGLEQKRKDALIAVVRVPRYHGKYPYKFTDGEQVQSGNLRVQGQSPRRPKPEPEAVQPRYRGPGSGVR